MSLLQQVIVGSRRIEFQMNKKAEKESETSISCEVWCSGLSIMENELFDFGVRTGKSTTKEDGRWADMQLYRYYVMLDLFLAVLCFLGKNRQWRVRAPPEGLYRIACAG